MNANAEMEGILSRRLDAILVGANTSSLKSFRRELFVLIGDQVSTEREVINTSTLATEIKRANLIIVDRSGASVSHEALPNAIRVMLLP